MKKAIKLFMFIVLSISLNIHGYSQSKKDIKRNDNNFTSGFDKKSTNPPKPMGPPPPDWEAPIPPGIGILAIGSFIFWGIKIRREFENE